MPSYNNDFYVPDQREEILRARGLGNFANTNQMISQADVSQNSTMRAVPATYGQQSNYIARQATPMAAPSEADIRMMFNDMRTNPDNYTDEDIEFGKNLYAQMFGGKLFSNDVGRAVNNAAFDFADTLMFGLIPDALGPKKLSTADDIGGMIGSAGAFFVPGVGPMAMGSKVANKALPALGKLAGRFGSKAGGAGMKIPVIFQKALGKETIDLSLQGLLNSPKVAARVGGAIGAGFNFEEGINPMGAMLGAAFPIYGNKGNALAGSADDVAKSVSQNIDDVVAKGENIVGQTDNVAATLDWNKEGIKKAEEYLRYTKQNPSTIPLTYDDRMKNAPGLAEEFGISVDEMKALINHVEDYNVIIPAQAGPTLSPLTAKPVVQQAEIPGLNTQGSPITSAPKTTATPFTNPDKFKTYEFGEYVVDITPQEAAKQLRDVKLADLDKIAQQIYLGTGESKNTVLGLITEAKKNNPQMTLSQLLTLLQ